MDANFEGHAKNEELMRLLNQGKGKKKSKQQNMYG